MSEKEATEAILRAQAELEQALRELEKMPAIRSIESLKPTADQRGSSWVRPFRYDAT